jgi:GTP-binding protein
MVCDVPGLIAGAHQNVGLGHAFLRHIHRCRILILLLDMAGTDGRLPWDDYRSLLAELELYDPSMLQKPRCLVANKMDHEGSKKLLIQFKRRIKNTPILPISALQHIGMDGLRQLIKGAMAGTVQK